MGKKNKSKKKAAVAAASATAAEVAAKSEKKAVKTEKKRITMQDLEAISDDESGSMPPEEEWDEEAIALKEAIMGGAFDHLLEREDGNGGEDDESIEEVELADDDDDDDESESENSELEPDAADDDDDENDNKDVEDEESESDEEEVDDEQEAEKVNDEEVEDESDNDDDDDEEEKQDEEKAEGSDESSEEEEEEEEDQVNVDNSIDQKNQFSSKALHVVTDELANEKKTLAWAETFDIIPPKPLECDDIHDDLKREVAFYDLALEAVQLGRKACQKAGVAFSRPDDFFAEMVKSDDHMARVKDRLIFETKKMEAVAQRRSNKEQKLRSKEAHANKLAEKAKRKKEHFQALQEWADSAKAQRSDAMGNDGPKKKGKKRQIADKKYGFGGKKGRFKQNDPKSMNDLSGYNPRGNFAGGMKRSSAAAASSSSSRNASKSGSGGKRKGKRARDASRSRR